MAESAGVRIVGDDDGYRIAFDGTVDEAVVDDVMRSLTLTLDERTSPTVVLDLRDAAVSSAASERIRRERARLAVAGVTVEVVGPCGGLQATTTHADGAATVVVTGDLDVSGVDPLVDAVDRCLHRTSLVRLDLAGVTFVDAAGLGGLLRCRRLAIRVGATLEVVATSPIVRTTIGLAHVEDALHPSEPAIDADRLRRN